MELRHRPRYHFQPPALWHNDPNGLMHWQGRYHLFYQHNPNGAFWGDMHWGHAVSADLVHWQHLPIALAPTPGGPDQDGVFSGCAIVHADAPMLVYTGVRPETQCLATPEDADLIRWRKHPANPVIAGPPPELAEQVTGFRDPYLWREDDGWLMALGSGLKGQGGAVLLYHSPDLLHWRYLHTLCEGRLAETGYNWECPNFFPLGDRHTLLLSLEPHRKAIYQTGAYRQRRFVPNCQGDVDCGGHLYAPQVMQDAYGRRLLWGWVWEGRSLQAQRAAGWAGAMSLPRVLGLTPDGRLLQEPAPELQILRGAYGSAGACDLGAMPMAIPAARGDAVEIELELALDGARQVTLHVRRSPDGQEETLLVYDRRVGRLECDRSRASLSPHQERALHGGAHPAPVDGVLHWRLFVDRSVIELYADGVACLTTRIYPTREDSDAFALSCQGGRARLLRLDAWQMGSIWPKRRSENG